MNFWGQYPHGRLSADNAARRVKFRVTIRFSVEKRGEFVFASDGNEVVFFYVDCSRYESVHSFNSEILFHLNARRVRSSLSEHIRQILLRL